MDLIFVDQTEKVSRRLFARRETEDVPEVVENKVSATCSNQVTLCPVQSQPSPHYALPVSIESLAQAFFFNNYAIVGPTCPYSDQRNSRRSAADLVSITAVGMAGLATFRKDLDLMVLARVKYQSSLRLIRRFLQNPPDALKERTAAAVFMMAMFEVSGSLIAFATD
jgi:hypothetical protein